MNIVFEQEQEKCQKCIKNIWHTLSKTNVPNSYNYLQICSSGMVKKMVFKGNVSKNMGSLSAKHQIKYPVNEGSALITFQEPSGEFKQISPL